MGNYISCSSTPVSGKYHSRYARVIFPDGSIRQLDAPANAAELMLDAPGYFLVNSCSMEVGRRFSPLTADEELEMASVYVMLPMGRVNSVVSAADVGRLLAGASKAARVLPAVSEINAPPPEQDRHESWSAGSPEKQRLKLDEIEDTSVLVEELQLYRVSMCRSRRPMLETILEETFCSR